MEWFVDALLRHCGRLATEHVLLRADWHGVSEADVVACVKRTVDGLGYTTWLEAPYTNQRNKKADLCAEDILRFDKNRYWWLEVKNDADGGIRLPEQRFKYVDKHGKGREYLRDFEKLSEGARPQDSGSAVWVGLSSQSDYQGLFGDAIKWTKAEFPKLDVVGNPCHGAFDVGRLLNNTDWSLRYAHVVVWDVPPGSCPKPPAP